jgi:hypothetical protein
MTDAGGAADEPTCSTYRQPPPVISAYLLCRIDQSTDVPIEFAEGLLAYLQERSGGFVLHVSGDDAAAVKAGVAVAAARIRAIRHPEQPDEAYASYLTSSDSEISADMHDAEAYEGILEAVLEAVASGLLDAGVESALVGAGPDPQARPEPPRENPPGFELPSGFPMPDGAESLDWDVKFHDDGGVQFLLRRSPEDIVSFYEVALLAAGFEVSSREPVRFHGTPVQRDGTRMVFRGRGWRGFVTVLSSSLTGTLRTDEAHWGRQVEEGQIQVQVHLSSDLSPAELRRGSGVAVTARRRFAYDYEPASAAAFLVGPEDLAGNWSAGHGPFRPWTCCFCPQDSIVRKGPNSRPLQTSGVRTLLSDEEHPVWIQESVDIFKDADAARREWAWVALDLDECRHFADRLPIGTSEAHGTGEWQEMALDCSADDVFGAAVRFEIEGGGRLVGQKARFKVDRFVGGLFVHGPAGFELPDIAPLVDIAVTRLRAVAAEFPAL